jgi:hypothetical protein
MSQENDHRWGLLAVSRDSRGLSAAEIKVSGKVMRFIKQGIRVQLEHMRTISRSQIAA